MPTTDEEDVLAVVQSETEAFYRGDIDAFLAHWHQGPQTHKILSGTQVGTRIHRGWDELLPRWLEGFRQMPQNFDARELLRTENVQVQVVGDLAWVVYDQVTVKPVPGMQVPPREHGVKIVQRFDGVWKFVCGVSIAPAIGRQGIPRIELGNDGQVVEINDLAKTRLAGHPGLIVSGNRLRARQRRFDAGLQDAIRTRMGHLATTLPPKFMEKHPTHVPLGDDIDGNALFCWVSAEQERVLITFDDAFLLRQKLEDAAVRFGISPAQLDVCERIAMGRDLAMPAEDLGVSVNTVRTQLRRMFDKTDTHSQAGLVSLLLNSQNPG